MGHPSLAESEAFMSTGNGLEQCIPHTQPSQSGCRDMHIPRSCRVGVRDAFLKTDNVTFDRRCEQAACVACL